MPASRVRAPIWAASRVSISTSPPSARSATSAAESTCLSLSAAAPVWELWASSAITAKRLPLVAVSSCIFLIRAGKVWIVQTTIFLSPERAAASCSLLMPFSLVIEATTPLRRS